ncbi:DUF3152 domain-containing protein [Bifidobacterium samirii]|uniref:DUF3152 domain-containing protein n=1 Tax=Bifidobacterium samirii TaxID=2306974 RepID=A0A430FWJ6_9BIFI|nr:DUF3152 domain-containing protein [Bifidobacterium samirii]RSX58419.1 hypothetical protein D2E24_0298 [Bifidobacterium samirii]
MADHRASRRRVDVSRERKYVLRRAIIGAVALLALIYAIAATVTAVGAIGAARGADDAPSAAQAAADGRDGQTDGADDADASDDGKKTDDGKSDGDAADADGTSEDDPFGVKAVHAADATAQPLTDAERAAIMERATAAAEASGNGVTTFTYCIATNGDVGSTVAFANTVYETLNDARGWTRAGAVFTQIADDACASADMAIILAQAERMTDYSLGCSTEYSCRVGNDVIVNADRWNGGTDTWLGAGGTLARYRTMVINHEVGHRLGHIDNETWCAAPGAAAPLMQEQSMGLDGCVGNEWPLDGELWIA